MNLLLILTALLQLTIEQCYDFARENYPLIKKYELIEKSKEYTLENASFTFLPQFSIRASASYQSDVVTLPFDSDLIPGIEIERLSKDQYGAFVELNQTIWDGGTYSATKKNIEAENDLRFKELEVELYSLKERINNIYFGILLLKQQMFQNEILMKELSQNRTRLEKCIDNGVANKSDLDIIDVEIISAQQNEVTLKATIDTYLSMLSLLIGKEIESSESLTAPTINLLNVYPHKKRPELSMFDSQIVELETQYDRLVAENMPKLSLFVKGGYGRPGLDLLKNEFDFYAVGGVKLVWDLGKLYYFNNGKRLIDNAIQQVGNMRETFIFNMDLMEKQNSGTYQKYLKLLEKDREVVELRKRIRQKTETAMELGTKNASDLITELAKEQIAIQEHNIHEIELLKTVYELKTIKNN